MSNFSMYYENIIKDFNQSLLDPSNEALNTIFYNDLSLRHIIIDKGLDICFVDNLSLHEKTQSLPLSTFDALEIGYCLSGDVRMQFPLTNEQIHFQKGDLCFNAISEATTTFSETLNNFSGFAIYIHRSFLENLVLGEHGENAKRSFHLLIHHLFDKQCCTILQPNIELVHLAEEISNTHFPIRDIVNIIKFKKLIHAFLFDALQSKTERNKKYGRQAQVELTKEILIKDFCNPPSMKELAFACQLHPTTLNRSFKEIYHCSIFEFIHKQRMINAKKLLNQGYNVTQCALEVGYSNPSQFSKSFQKYYGTNPKNYKK